MRLRRFLKPAIIVIVCIILLPILLFVGVLIALTIPSVQQRVAEAAARILSEKTGIEASVRHFSVRPPFDILLKDVYAGNGQGDTLAFIGCLDVRLRLDALPDSIVVRHFSIDNLTAHTGELIPSLAIDGKIGCLSADIEPFGIKEMSFSIGNAILEDTDVFLSLNPDYRKDPADSSETDLCIDIQDISLRDVNFGLEPAGLKLGIAGAGASALIDLKASRYDVRRLEVTDTDFGIGNFKVLLGSLDADAVVDIGKSFISSNRLAVSVPSMQAEASLSDTWFDLAQMRVATTGEGSFAGSGFSLNADYDIDDGNYRANLDFERINLAEILKMPGSDIVVAGHVRASGMGINPSDREMAADVLVGLDKCRFDGIDVSGIRLSANLRDGIARGTIAAPVHYRDSSVTATLNLDGRFAASGFTDRYPGLELEARLTDIDVEIPGDSLTINDLTLDLKSGKASSSAVVEMPGISLAANIPAHVLKIPSLLPSFPGEIKTFGALDSLLASFPEVDADLKISQDSPLTPLLRKRGFDLRELSATLSSVGTSRNLRVSLETPDLNGKYRLPAMSASLVADLLENGMDATLKLDAMVRDGIMSIKGIDSGLNLNSVLSRRGEDLKIDGDLKLADIVYDGKNIGNRNVLFDLRPDNGDSGHFVANAYLDDIPVDLAKQFVTLPEEIGIQGKLRAHAGFSGLPDKVAITAGVIPVGVTAAYLPYDVRLKLSEKEITLEDNKVNLNGLSIIGAEDTFITLNGGLDLDTKLLDVSVKSDAFEPAKLPKDGPIPVYGRLLTRLDGSIKGPVDSLLASVDVSIQPETDLTYPIDAKNLAQINPSGTVNVGFNPKTGLRLNGNVNVDKGKVFYSPKLYPMMPFSIDKGSCIKFKGTLDDTELAISASQEAKATYKPYGEVSRTVDFITGVKLGGSLKKIDIGFYLDAPKDKEIQRELAATSEEDREGLAAVLLATGMYASESNEAVQMYGYGLSSIVQSRINALMSNKWGNKIKLDLGVGMGKHGQGIETTDYSLNVSKSFFNDRLTVKLGGSVSDNAEVNKNAAAFLNNLSAEYKVDTTGALKVRLFSERDFNNIIEGELYKSGAGVLYNKTLDRSRDSLDRSLSLEVDGNFVYRSNHQIGPDAVVSLSKNNIFGKNDVFTTKLSGAYYWDLKKRPPENPSRNDTYLFGADFSLKFPYMQLGEWARKYNGQTSYRLGYLNESVAGSYGMNRLYCGIDYGLRQGKYISHGFSPIGLSFVLAAGIPDKLPQSLSYENLLQLFAGNEFVPSMGYSFTFSNYRDKSRNVFTALDIQLKESANLISGIMAACGRDFNERNKKLLGINYDQFVKCRFELRNKFVLADRVEFATRAMAGAVITYGNSVAAPLSESFSIGGPNSIRAFAPNSLGPGDFHSAKYSSQIFYKGDIKLEMNAELRFPIFWKINGALFVDAGNVWNMRNPDTYMSKEDIEALLKAFELSEMYHSNLDAKTFLNQIALGTGFGLRLDYESIVVRLDLGIALHAPYNTGRTGYYNISNFWKEGIRLNFGIGYPF